MQELRTAAPLPRLTGEEDLPDELPLPPGFRGWLTWLTRVPNLPNPRRKRDILFWWERRRITYNLVVGGVGFAGYALFVLLWFQESASHSHATFSTRDDLIITPIDILIAMNLAYCAGGFVELALAVFGIRDRRIGPTLLSLGFAFALLVIGGSAVMAIGITLAAVLKH